MSWLDFLRTASFKNIPFKVDVSDFSSGRRVVVHEHPQKEKSFAEDLGKNTREIRLEGWVLGKHYFLQRDALLNACEEPEAGELVHPFLGTLNVVCTNVSVRESTSEGRMARFAFTFVETGDAVFPQATQNPVFQLDKTIDEASNLHESLFADSFTVEKTLSFVHSDATALNQRFWTSTDNLTTSFQSQPQDISSFRQQTQKRQASAHHDVLQPEFLSQEIGSIISQIKNHFIEPQNALSAYCSLMQFGSDIDHLTQWNTSSYLQLRQNQLFFLNLIQGCALLESIRVAINTSFSCWDEAIRTRDQLVATLDMHLENTDDTSLYASLSAIRAQFILCIPRSADLPKLTQYTLLCTQSSLVLAHQLYQDVRYADHLVQNNGIIHPGFIAAGSTLKVFM